jgi:hypothetical protein
MNPGTQDRGLPGLKESRYKGQVLVLTPGVKVQITQGPVWVSAEIQVWEDRVPPGLQESKYGEQGRESLYSGNPGTEDTDRVQTIL